MEGPDDEWAPCFVTRPKRLYGSWRAYFQKAHPPHRRRREDLSVRFVSSLPPKGSRVGERKWFGAQNS